MRVIFARDPEKPTAWGGEGKIIQLFSCKYRVFVSSLKISPPI